MGAGAFSIWKLLIILAIIMVIFGTKKLKSLGTDLGGAIKGFKNAMDDGKKDDLADGTNDSAAMNGATIDVKPERVEEPR
ncbi:MAG TPA: Sec-independent protein translocase subunit TatA [Pseudomonadales bacterium]